MRPCKTLLLIGLCCSLGCKQTYLPPTVANPPDYLVVEGFINTNPGESTLFNLSHTVKLDTNLYLPECGATVVVEGADNSSWPLNEFSAGTYSAPLPGLDYNTKYRLHITTRTGKQYASDYIPLVPSPPIDSISWRRLENPPNTGIQIFANTHNPQNNTHYYRWEYTETWEFHSPYVANVQYVPGIGIQPYYNNTTHICWHTNQSSRIVLGTSAQLSQDLIHEAPVVLIPFNSQQLTVRYSILVKQYGLTKDAFTWWQLLQNNTEEIGSIFGVQPSADKGNIHCLTDTTEQVLGFVGGGGIQSQRIFIANAQVQPWDYVSGCIDQKVANTLDSLKFWTSVGFLPWATEFPPPTVHMSYNTCVDCTLTGTNVKPSFW